MTFTGIYAYVTLKEGAVIKLEDLVLQLKDLVKKEIGSFAVPEIIQVDFLIHCISNIYSFQILKFSFLN